MENSSIFRAISFHLVSPNPFVVFNRCDISAANRSARPHIIGKTFHFSVERTNVLALASSDVSATTPFGSRMPFNQPRNPISRQHIEFLLLWQFRNAPTFGQIRQSASSHWFERRVYHCQAGANNSNRTHRNSLRMLHLSVSSHHRNVDV